MDIKKIGFIGLGVMGAPMAGHLLDAGFELKLYTRTKDRAAELLARGATWCDTPADCARDCDVVISMVGYPQDVREVWMGRYGAFHTMKPGAIGVDMTTSAPELAQELSQQAGCSSIPISEQCELLLPDGRHRNHSGDRSYSQG